MRAALRVAVLSLVLLVGSSFALDPIHEAGFAKLRYHDQSIKYGKFETRMHVPVIPGTVPNFYLITREDGKWEEIDYEWLGKLPDGFASNVHSNYNNFTSDYYQPFHFRIDEGYHTYAIEWAPDYLKWFVDGVMVRSSVEKNGQILEEFWDTRGNSLGSRTKSHNYLQSFRNINGMFYEWTFWVCNQWNWCGNWAGTFDKWSGCYKSMFISWFKLYRYAKGQGEGGSDFVLEDWDDFNGEDIDYSKWINDIDPQNTVLYNGKAVMNMNCDVHGDVGEGGYKGITPYPEDPEDDGRHFKDVVSTRSVGLSSLNAKNVIINPFYRNGMIYLNASNVSVHKVQLCDLRGSVIATLNPQSHSRGYQLPGHIAQGSYILRLQDTDGSQLYSGFFQIVN